MKIRKDIDLLPSYSANEFQADIILDANESAFNIPLSLQNIIADLIKNYTFHKIHQILFIISISSLVRFKIFSFASSNVISSI